MSVTQSHSQLFWEIENYFADKELMDIPRFIWWFGTTYMIPIGVTCLCLGLSMHCFMYVKRKFIPIPDKERYLQAKEYYRTKQIKLALTEWNDMDHYGPAYLAQAVHYIYVEGNVKKGLQFLDHAQDIQAAKLSKHAADTIRMDAKAIQQGNAIMVDMNAKLAKQEYLGIIC